MATTQSLTSRRHAGVMVRDPTPLELEGSARSLTHSFFRFPGKLHPPLVRDLIRRHPEAKRITDPMAGCGTVAVEAVAAGREGLFGDIDPLSCLVTGVKVSTLNLHTLSSEFWETIASAQAMLGTKPGDWAEALLAELTVRTAYRPPENVFHWFERDVVAGLAAVLLQIQDRKSRWPRELTNAMHAIVAASIRSLSRADPMPVSCIGVTKVRKKQLDAGKVEFDVWRILERKHDALVRGLTQLRNRDVLGSARVLNVDARNWAETCKANDFQADLAITSPPYCHAIEYWRRHSMEYAWLGLIADDRHAKSSHHKRFIGTKLLKPASKTKLPAPVEKVLKEIGQSSTPKAVKAEQLLRQYFEDLRDWFAQYNDVLAPNGTLYAVIGPSTVYGVAVPTPQLAGHLAESAGLKWLDDSTHGYTNTVMQYPTRHGKRVSSETVLTLRLRISPQ